MTHNERIINLINDANKDYNLTLSVNDVVFGVPTKSDNINYNTMLSLTPRDETVFLPKKRNIYYNRVAISDLVDASFKINISYENKLSDIINYVNAYFGITIEASDYYDVDIDKVNQQVELKIRPESLLYFGSYMLHLDI